MLYKTDAIRCDNLRNYAYQQNRGVLSYVQNKNRYFIYKCSYFLGHPINDGACNLSLTIMEMIFDAFTLIDLRSGRNIIPDSGR